MIRFDPSSGPPVPPSLGRVRASLRISPVPYAFYMQGLFAGSSPRLLVTPFGNYSVYTPVEGLVLGSA
jgi:hypothetical protein